MMFKLKNKKHIRAIGIFGVVVTIGSLLLKAMYCAQMPLQARIDMAILIGLIVGFSLINSAALLQLRGRLESLERRR